MSSAIQLIVGLGNPGAKYESTRHNAGAWFVTELVRLAKATLRSEPKFQALHCATQLHGQPCHLLVPTTFMNLSGQAVIACADYYKISPRSILIVHDDIDLPPGDTRLKFDGGHGGHNGLADIISHLNTKQFYRLRIGVGHPSKNENFVDYVLHPPQKIEREQINLALQKAHSVIPLIMDNQMQKAMQTLNTNASSSPDPVNRKIEE